jgi:hypothetical protein
MHITAIGRSPKTLTTFSPNTFDDDDDDDDDDGGGLIDCLIDELMLMLNTLSERFPRMISL